MHLIDLSVNFLGCVPIVGSTIPIGVGAAFGAMLQDRAALTVIFFGDAATETGVFHESVNFAAVHRLPVLFVCENNLYSVNTPLDARQPGNRTIAEMARGHGIGPRSTTATGRDRRCGAAETIAHIRDQGGPAFLEFMTYRWLEHCGPLDDVHLGYRTQAGVRCLGRAMPRPPAPPAARGRGPHRRDGARRHRRRDRRGDRRRRRVCAESPFPARTELSRHMYA